MNAPLRICTKDVAEEVPVDQHEAPAKVYHSDPAVRPEVVLPPPHHLLDGGESGFPGQGVQRLQFSVARGVVGGVACLATGPCPDLDALDSCATSFLAHECHSTPSSKGPAHQDHDTTSAWCTCPCAHQPGCQEGKGRDRRGERDTQRGRERERWGRETGRERQRDTHRETEIERKRDSTRS
jgi:hypothetical protein